MSAHKQKTYSTRGRKVDTRWSDIDKTRLYSIGTVMYSALTVALHPLTVAKIRSQTQLPPLLPSGSILNNISQYYRGLGVVVSLAIPARIIYISTLEYSREMVDVNARKFLSNPPAVLDPYNKEILRLDPLVTPLAGGIAGGLAAVSSQLIVVPMDVISQKLIVMQDSVFKTKGDTITMARSIVKSEGWRGLYKGFGLSLFTSLPAGSIWWAAYAGCQDILSIYGDPDVCVLNDAIRSIPLTARQVTIQVTSAFSAAVAAAVFTQPLDTIKTRRQVGNTGVKKPKSSLLAVAKELTSTSGLYKGLFPRIAHMGIWGSVLSAAYEILKLVSRKDYEL